MEEAKNLDILVNPSATVPDRMFPSVRPVSTLISIAVSELKQALSAEILAVARCFSAVDLTETRYDLREVTFALNVSAEGKVQLIGGIGVSSGTALTVKLERK